MQKINVGTHKINGPWLKTYYMVIATFQVLDKLGYFYFFQKTFLLAKISIKVDIGMFFFIFSNANIQFAKKKLIKRIYTIAKALPTT